MTNKIVDDYARYLGRTASSNFASGPFISGNSGVGNVLSVSNGPFLAPTYQWRKNGVNISGATSQTYTQTINDQGNVIDAVVSGFASVNQIAVPLQLVEMAIAYGGSAFTNVYTTTPNLQVQSRTRFKIQVSKNGTARLPFTNSYIKNAVPGIVNGPALSIIQCAYETATGFIPVTFNGNQGISVPAGPAIVWSDPFPINFAQGDLVWVRTWADVPNGFPNYSFVGDIWSDGTTQCILFNPGTAGVGVAYATGLFPTNANTFAQTFAYGPVNIVAPVPSNTVSTFGGSDSIAFGVQDFQSVATGQGGYQRQAAFTQNRPYTAMSLTGRQITNVLATTTLLTNLAAFHSYASCDAGTNDIANGNSGATTLANAKTLWALLAANLVGVKFVNQMTLLPRVTDATTRLTTLAGQVPISGFDVGGNRDIFNAGVIAAVGTNGLTGYVDCTSVVQDPTATQKWKLRTFASTFTTAYVSGATIRLADSPAIGEVIIGDPGGAQQSTGNGLVGAVSGSGPYVCILTSNLITAQTLGNTAKAAPSSDGTHPSAVVTLDMAVVEEAWYVAHPPA